MANEITIQVIGKSATGKTTIAQEIVDILRFHRFNVEWDVSPDHHGEDYARKQHTDQECRLNAIRLKEPKITVKEVQAIHKITP